MQDLVEITRLTCNDLKVVEATNKTIKMEEKEVINGEVKELITEGGYKYIESEEGIKVRNTLVGRRIKEDGETFEEYKIRRQFVKDFDKSKKMGNWYWLGKFGTYDKKKVEEFLKNQENG